MNNAFHSNPFMNLAEKLTQGSLFKAYIIPALLMLFIGTFTYNGDALSKETAPHEPVQQQEVQEVIESAAKSDMDVEPVAGTTPVFDTEALAAIVEQARLNPQKMTPLPVEQIDTETLWLARCIYSETKRPEEQELVAWVVRNRVETGYRGERTYEDVVLDPYQFSAFNPGGRKRDYYSSLSTHDGEVGWQNALRIAYHVQFADASARPFPEDTRHFYSQQSMAGQGHPNWSRGLKPVKPLRAVQLEAKRFRFFEGVS